MHKNAFLETAKDLYETWSIPPEDERQVVPVFYCSAYGYTGELSAAIAQGILHVLPDADVPVYDLTVPRSAKACLLNQR